MYTCTSADQLAMHVVLCGEKHEVREACAVTVDSVDSIG